jgi:hypothetical protein
MDKLFLFTFDKPFHLFATGSAFPCPLSQQHPPPISQTLRAVRGHPIGNPRAVAWMTKDEWHEKISLGIQGDAKYQRTNLPTKRKFQRCLTCLTLLNSPSLTMHHCTRSVQRLQDQRRQSVTGTDRKFRESLLSESTVFSRRTLRLNNLRYLSSLSAQRVPKLDDSVGNTPCRCNC